MDTGSLVTVKQRAELQSLIAEVHTDKETPPEPFHWRQLESEQRQEYEKKIKLADERISQLVWHERGRMLNGRVLPHTSAEAVLTESHEVAERTVESSDWITVDQPDEQTQVQAQIRFHYDQTRWQAESGSTHVTQSTPVSTIWLRLHDIETEQATTPEEIFSVASYNVLFRGDAVGLDSSSWGELDLLLTDIETHFSPALAQQ